MANLIIYRKSDGFIKYFFENAIIFNKSVSGINAKLSGKTLESPDFAIKWIDDADIPTPIPDNITGGPVGYVENESDYTEISDPGLTIIRHSDRELYKEAIIKRKELADLTFSQLETYIDSNVTDFATAKDFIQKLAKVVLGIIKIDEYSE